MLRALSGVRQCLSAGLGTLSRRTLATPSTTADSASATNEAVATDDNLNEASASISVIPAVKVTYSRDAIQKLKLDEYPYYVEREWWKKGKRMTFWATWRQNRDVGRRETIQQCGADRMRLKAIKSNTILPQAIRDEAAEELHNMPKYSRPRLVLNMCQFTGRQRGKIKPYRLSRHLFSTRMSIINMQLNNMENRLDGLNNNTLENQEIRRSQST